MARLCGFGEFGKTSVVKEVISPDQNYVAELVDVDEGALGGETLVNVKEVRQPEQQTQQKQKNYTTGRMTNCSIYDTLINNLKPMIYQIRIRNYLNNVSCIVL